jgi:hypothetical protein
VANPFVEGIVTDVTTDGVVTISYMDGEVSREAIITLVATWDRMRFLVGAHVTIGFASSFIPMPPA